MNKCFLVLLRTRNVSSFIEKKKKRKGNTLIQTASAFWMFCIPADLDTMTMCYLISVEMKYRSQILRYFWTKPCQAEKLGFEVTRSLGFTFFSAFNLVFFKSGMSSLQSLAVTEGVYISDELFIFQNLDFLSQLRVWWQDKRMLTALLLPVFWSLYFRQKHIVL